ncbi:ABC transporter permease [Corynebacterium pacaense]|uniref:ABC transporter permease n=1 Tax=Corynebacterium pacaense TaxID=1816684 RepID=UPI0009BB3946|nr:ABC transporter permease [Corynebacterium pacaense]
MSRYIINRVLQGLLVIWAAFTFTFVVLYLLPSDPVAILLGTDSNFTEEELNRMREAYGLNDPWYIQYLSYLVNFLRGDFGSSIQTGTPVLSEILGALPNTILLAVASLMVAVVIAGVVAVLAVFVRVGWLKNILLSAPSFISAIPGFWLALMLLQIFSFRFQLLPGVGTEGVSTLILPALALGIPVSAEIAQVFTRSLQNTLDKPYIITARSRGWSYFSTITRHALRNSLLPTFTVFGLSVAGILSGVVVIETVFSRAGLGRIAQVATTNQDIPLVQGVVVFSAVIYVVINLVIDLIYPLIDPRIRLQEARTP